MLDEAAKINIIYKRGLKRKTGHTYGRFYISWTGINPFLIWKIFHLQTLCYLQSGQVEHFVSPVFPFSVAEVEAADVPVFPFAVAVAEVADVLVFPSVEVADALHAAAVPVV